MKTKRSLAELYKAYGVYVLLIVLCAVLSILAPGKFLTISNLINILRQCSVYAILAFGMTYIFIGDALDIGLWPTSMVFHKGEAIQVNIAGFDFYGITGAWDDAITFNDGKHFVRTGGKYDSYLVYPEIPQA